MFGFFSILGQLTCTKHRDSTVTIPDTDHRTCYYFYEVNKRYKDAKKICEAGGTHLVHLETDQEERRLHGLMSGKLRKQHESTWSI